MTWTVPEGEIRLRFSPSGGPGGQHANRSSTRVEATWDVVTSPGVPDRLRRRVIDELGPVVRVVVDEERSQYRNREIAIERLRSRVAAAGREKRRRVPTKASAARKRQRVEAKRRRGQLKRFRRRPTLED